MLLFTAALNNELTSEVDSSVATRKSGSKRAIEWDLNTSGFRYPPLKKMAFLDDELDVLFVPSNTGECLLV